MISQGFNVDIQRGLGMVLEVEVEEPTYLSTCTVYWIQGKKSRWVKGGKTHKGDARLDRMYKLIGSRHSVEDGGNVWKLVACSGEGTLIKERTIEILIEDH